MKKFFITLLIMLMGINLTFAQCIKVPKKNFNSVINNSGIERNSISISIKDLKTGRNIYQLNDKMLMHPASCQKILTLVPAMEILGNEYEFSTELYKRSDESYIIKLGADPYLKTSDLKNLVKVIPTKTQNLYVDDSIVEQKDWGEGWQWDDDLNTLMPKFNAYNLDKNLIKVTILPTNKGQLATVMNNTKYPLVFLNHVVTGEHNNIQVSRDNSISNNTLALSGTVRTPQPVQIPTNNLKRYFNIKLSNILSEKNIYLIQNVTINKITENDQEIKTIGHPISQAIDDILKNSNNMVSEIVVKLAGGKAYNDRGTDLYGIRLFNEYCKKNKLDNSRIRLSDASGVSKNNLVTTDFITSFLILNKKNEVLQHMATPGEGTLSKRMLPLKDNLKAKTGTLADTSSLSGFLTSKRGNKYAFSIIINDPSTTSYDKKTLEDYLIREAYLHL